MSPNVRGIAHDLNNQIMILMNALDRVMILCPDEPDAQSAVKAAERCASLTSQLLPPPSQPSATPGASVREIVSEAAMLVRPLLPACNRVDVSCHADSQVAAPASEIQQALVNLCINAGEAMDGPGVIQIAVEQCAGSVILSVSDTGPGIAAHPDCSAGFHRVRATVEQYGGALSVTDVFPHGACFRIELPAV